MFEKKRTPLYNIGSSFLRSSSNILAKSSHLQSTNFLTSKGLPETLTLMIGSDSIYDAKISQLIYMHHVFYLSET